MSARARVGAFVALLAVVFAGAALLGGALDPGSGGDDGRPGAAATHAGEAEHGTPAPGADHGDRDAADRRDGGGAGAGARTTTADAVPTGVSTTQRGLQLVVERTRFAAGRPAELRFRIIDRRGAVVRRFDVEQARRMHVIVVRRDLRHYQHLHPTMRPDGSWATRLTLSAAGVYRAYADFSSRGARRTLGADLFVPGNFQPLALPVAQDAARVAGYDVTLRDRGPDGLRFAVSRRGRPVADLQPYLGSRGHLVVLREGDLAYRHAHPLDERGLAFHSGPREPGTYRMFLQFRHRDRVHTAAFTRVVKP